VSEASDASEASEWAKRAMRAKRASGEMGLDGVDVSRRRAGGGLQTHWARIPWPLGLGQQAQASPGGADRR